MTSIASVDGVVLRVYSWMGRSGKCRVELGYCWNLNYSVLYSIKWKVLEIQQGIILYLVWEGGFYMLSIIHVHDYIMEIVH